MYSLIIPSPFSPIPPTLLPLGNHQNVLCVYESVSVLLGGQGACLFVCLFGWLVFRLHILSEIIQQFLFLCLSSLSTIPSRSTHVVADGKISLFFFLAESYSIVYMHHFFFIHSSNDGHLGCLLISATVNNAAINISMYIFFSI